jgi:hypothetical protein
LRRLRNKRGTKECNVYIKTISILTTILRKNQYKEGINFCIYLKKASLSDVNFIFLFKVGRLSRVMGAKENSGSVHCRKIDLANP